MADLEKLREAERLLGEVSGDIAAVSHSQNDSSLAVMENENVEELQLSPMPEKAWVVDCIEGIGKNHVPCLSQGEVFLTAQSHYWMQP